MRRITAGVLVAVLVAAIPMVSSGAQRGAIKRYVVLFEDGVSEPEARTVIRALDARTLRFNDAIGLATVSSTRPTFVSDAMATGAIRGVARERTIGRTPDEHPRWAPSEQPSREAPLRPTGTKDKSLANRQWAMRMIDAGPGRSYDIELGSGNVLVGVIDGGVEARHPEIKPSMVRSLSRNFTTDIPEIDGPCGAEKDNSCEDSAFEDPGGHGTWVASSIVGANDGFGTNGVAPRVGLVNLRAGQDSGYFFLQPVVDALTFAGDNGIDVVNMSFYVDPWLFNCLDNPADDEDARLEQQTIIDATQEALDYARTRGVTLVAALGNFDTDLGDPGVDHYSPNFPPGSEYNRDIDNDTCLSMPAEADGVISVSGLGPSKGKAGYSNYGVEQTDLSGPGGDTSDSAKRYPFNQPVAGTSTRSVKDSGQVDNGGKPTVPGVVRLCRRGRCSYYTYISGTSMAAPHVAGVAALIVSHYGGPDPDGGVTMSPADVESRLIAAAVQHDCPSGSQRCEEGADGFNGFYGHGIVNALNAVTAAP